MRPFLTLHDPASAAAYYEAGLWKREAFYMLLAAHARRAPDDLAIMDGRQSLDWRTLQARVDAMADELVEKEISAGDSIAVWMSNRVEAVVAFLACSREGIACNVALHKSHTCREVVDMLSALKSKAIVTEPGWGADRRQKDFAAMLAELPFLRRVYSPENFPRHITQVERPPFSNADSVAYLAFTSGTTGEPKCVMHSSNTLLANARDLVRDWRLDSSATILSLSPLSHHIAWVAIAQWLVCGGRFVTNDPPEGKSGLDWLLETGATYVLGVPTHAIDVLAEQKARDISGLGEVRVFYLAGAPIPPHVIQSLLDQGVSPQCVYGMTENSSHQYTHPDDPAETALESCGRGGSAYEVRIWDPENPDREMPVGETGEIGGKGAAMMLGYFADQAGTHAAFNRHGYLLSGDLGSLDAAGNLRVEGRKKDMIIRGGRNIVPSRIEVMAAAHPQARRVAAFGVPDERLGEKICLAVAGAVGPDEMLRHLAGCGLSKFDMPELFISLAELPMTASGKVLKRELADLVRRSELSPSHVRYVEENV